VTLTTVAKYGTPRASDHNGAISGTDAAQIARSSVGLVTLTTNQRLAGDVTGNGTLSALDAAQVARFAVQLVDHFDVAITTGSDWAFRRCDAYAFPGDPGCGAPSYSFTPISQAESGKNFYAVLYGDVTGNWAPAALFTAADAGVREPASIDRAAYATVTPSVKATTSQASDAASTGLARISIDNVPPTLAAGERRTLVVQVTNAEGILGLDLSLAYDASRIAIVGVESTGLASGWGVAHSDTRGTHRISTYGLTPLAGGGAVLTVTVEGLAGRGSAVPLELTAVANEGAIPLRVQPRVGAPSTQR
jgi:hypothetical protein